MRRGTGWGYVKEDLFQLLDEQLHEPRARYKELMQDKIPALPANCAFGAEKARPHAQALLKKVRTAIGVEL